MTKSLFLIIFSIFALNLAAGVETTNEVPGEEPVEVIDRGRIAEAARAAMDQLPSYGDISRIENEELRSTLTRLVEIIQEATFAEDLAEDDLTNLIVEFNGTVEAVDAGVFVAYENEDSCTRKCQLERRQCIQEECGSGTTYPCFCCVPCNIAWGVCLAACVV